MSTLIASNNRTEHNRAKRIAEIKTNLDGLIALDHEMGMSLVEELVGWISNRHDHSLEFRARAIMALLDLLTMRELGVVLRGAQFYNTAESARIWNQRNAAEAVAA